MSEHNPNEPKTLEMRIAALEDQVSKQHTHPAPCAAVCPCAAAQPAVCPCQAPVCPCAAGMHAMVCPCQAPVCPCGGMHAMVCPCAGVHAMVCPCMHPMVCPCMPGVPPCAQVCPCMASANVCPCLAGAAVCMGHVCATQGTASGQPAPSSQAFGDLGK